jgi:hypothetical protein
VPAAEVPRATAQYVPVPCSWCACHVSFTWCVLSCVAANISSARMYTPRRPLRRVTDADDEGMVRTAYCVPHFPLLLLYLVLTRFELFCTDAMRYLRCCFWVQSTDANSSSWFASRKQRIAARRVSCCCRRSVVHSSLPACVRHPATVLHRRTHVRARRHCSRCVAAPQGGPVRAPGGGTPSKRLRSDSVSDSVRVDTGGDGGVAPPSLPRAAMPPSAPAVTVIAVTVPATQSSDDAPVCVDCYNPRTVSCVNVYVAVLVRAGADGDVLCCVCVSQAVAACRGGSGSTSEPRSVCGAKDASQGAACVTTATTVVGATAVPGFPAALVQALSQARDRAHNSSGSSGSAGSGTGSGDGAATVTATVAGSSSDTDGSAYDWSLHAPLDRTVRGVVCTARPPKQSPSPLRRLPIGVAVGVADTAAVPTAVPAAVRVGVPAVAAVSVVGTPSRAVSAAVAATTSGRGDAAPVWSTPAGATPPRTLPARACAHAPAIVGAAAGSPASAPARPASGGGCGAAAGSPSSAPVHALKGGATAAAAGAAGADVTCGGDAARGLVKSALLSLPPAMGDADESRGLAQYFDSERYQLLAQWFRRQCHTPNILVPESRRRVAVHH